MDVGSKSSTCEAMRFMKSANRLGTFSMLILLLILICRRENLVWVFIRAFHLFFIPLKQVEIDTLTFNLDIVNFLIHSQCRLEFLSVRNNKIDWLYEFFQKLPRMKTIRYLDFANNSPTVSCYGLHDTILSNYSLGWINTGGFDFIQEAEFVIHRMDLNNAGIGLTHDESIPISLWPIILARINFLLFRGFQNAQYWKKFPRPKTIFKYDNWSPSKTYYFTNERRSTTMFEMIRASPPALFDLNRPWII